MGKLEQDFESHLFQLIPLTKNLGINIVEVDDSHVLIHGSYQINKNHLDIVFGGSIAAISITTAWSLVQNKVQQEGLKGKLVIKHQEIDYLLPVNSDFECIATLHEDSNWDAFISSYQQTGRAKIRIISHITCNGVVTSRLVGLFILYK